MVSEEKSNESAAGASTLETPNKRARTATMATGHRAITPRPASARIQQQQAVRHRPTPILPSISAAAPAPKLAPIHSNNNSNAGNMAGHGGGGNGTVGGMVAIAPSPRLFSPMGTPAGNLSRGIGALALSSPACAKTGPDGAKTEKGLRQFSAMVCAKVEEKGITTYNEVADELVQEIGAESSTGERFDHKNIRRRVYDALNVLMAIDVIAKDKKEIRWLGLPNDLASDLRILEAEKAAAEKRLQEKKRSLNELLRRLVSLKSLINRNRRMEAKGSVEKLALPFILINAPKDCRVHCEMLEDRTQYFFQFDSPFFINEDVEVLRLMGMDSGSVEELAAWMPMDLLAVWNGGKVPILEGNGNQRINVRALPKPTGHASSAMVHSSPTGKRPSALRGNRSANAHLNFLNPPIKRHSVTSHTASTASTNNLMSVPEFLSDLGNYNAGGNVNTNGKREEHPLSTFTNLGSSPII